VEECQLFAESEIASLAACIRAVTPGRDACATLWSERRMGRMNVEILHIDECPNWQEAGLRMRSALSETGHDDVAVRYRLLESSDDADGTMFAGSPTVAVDGVDLFPTGERTSELCCRIYFTPAGIAGAPTTEQFVERLRAL
jgi:hypothetical protein